MWCLLLCVPQQYSSGAILSRTAKVKYAMPGKKKLKSDHARERFRISSKQRMEQAEREKEDKRAARREAALKAKANPPAANARPQTKRSYRPSSGQPQILSPPPRPVPPPNKLAQKISKPNLNALSPLPNKRVQMSPTDKLAEAICKQQRQTGHIQCRRGGRKS